MSHEELLLVLPCQENKLKPLVALVEQFLDAWFVKTPGQLIPDSLHPNIPNRALISVFKAKGVIELDRFRLGGYHERTTKNRKAHSDLDLTYSQLQQQLQDTIEVFIHDWFRCHPTELLSAERLDTIKAILHILFDRTLQLSESSLTWAIKYGLACTSGGWHGQNTLFSFSTSIAGDTTPPPYVESYVMEPLQKLSRLNQLYQQKKISFVPRFAIVFTLYSQLVENIRDHSGQLMHHDRHVYTSWVTCERIARFIQVFFADIAPLCDFIEFPPYDFVSPARLFFNLIWQEIPLSLTDREKLFVIKGEVEKPDAHYKRHDPIGLMLQGNPGSYVGRHLFSNLIFSEKDTLRFASDATEPQFHITPMAMYQLLADRKEEFLDLFKGKIKQLKTLLHYFNEFHEHPTLHQNQEDICTMLSKQLLMHPLNSKIHAQVGMHNTHASYYRHRLEPSFVEMVSHGFYDAPQLRASQREDKASKLVETFNRITQYTGQTAYFEFLQEWVIKYEQEPQLLRQKIHLQTMGILSENRSRSILNYLL